jgi:hypothetical protein
VNTRCLLVLAASLLLSFQMSARADDGGTTSDDDSIWSQLLDGSISGRARVYNYRHWDFENAPYPNQPQDSSHDDQATFFGADLLMRTGSVAGFSGGLSVFSQQRLIGYAVPNTEVPPTNQLAESFLQFQKSILQLRFGRQMLSTPFADGDMFTATTRSFYGTSASLHLLDSGAPPPGKFSDQGPDDNPPSGFDPAVQLPFDFKSKPGPADLKLYFARMTRYESRFSEEFTDTNRYSPGINAVDPAVPATTPGLFTVGAQYQQSLPGGDVMARAWYYTFFDYAKLQYYEGGYQAPAADGGGPRPFVMGQYTHEDEAGSAAAGAVDADVYGLKLGVDSVKWNVALLGEYSPSHPGNFRNGGLIHPYTDFAGVLYDDTLNNGLENLGPGRAYGMQWDIMPAKQLTAYLRVVHYVADYGTNGSFYDYSGPMGFAGNSLLDDALVPDQSSNTVDIGWTYQLDSLTHSHHGFSIGDDIEARSGFGSRNTFYEDRFRLVYSF